MACISAGTHRVIPTDTCLLENKTAKRIILAIKQIMQHYHMEPYNEDTGKGFMRHAVVRVGHSSNEILVTVVTNESAFPGSRNFWSGTRQTRPRYYHHRTERKYPTNQRHPRSGRKNVVRSWFYPRQTLWISLPHFITFVLSS